MKSLNKKQKLMEGDAVRYPAITIKDPAPSSSIKPPETASLICSKDSSSKKDLCHLERDRREKMTEFYGMLQAMVPNLFPKATRTRVIDETISYIKTLEEVIVSLETEKASRAAQAMLRTESSSSIQVTVCGGTACFQVCFKSRPGMATRVLEVMEKNNAEVLTASLVCEDQVGKMNVAAILHGKEQEEEEEEEKSLMRIKEEILRC